MNSKFIKTKVIVREEDKNENFVSEYITDFIFNIDDVLDMLRVDREAVLIEGELYEGPFWSLIIVKDGVELEVTIADEIVCGVNSKEDIKRIFRN